MELLPLLRWLALHLRPQWAVAVEDESGLSVSPLRAALPPGARYDVLVPGAGAPAADLIHVAAPLPPEALGTLAAALAPGGLLLAAQGGLSGGVPLPVGDGVTLLAGRQPPPVFTWLSALPEDSRVELAACFAALGAQIAAAAAREGRAAQAALFERASARAAVQAAALLQVARQERDTVRAELAQAIAQRDAITQSTSWRLTAPLRAALLKLRASRGAPPDPVPDPKPDKKALFKAESEQALWDFLVSAERLQLPRHSAPETSILLVLFNQAPLTFQCLKSITETLAADAAVEVVIVDNASSDDTALLLGRVDGAVVIRNTENLHFLHGMNQAAAAAAGQDLLLLNNDARLRAGALQSARRTLYSSNTVGAVGARIILPDGTLQEAGSIIWQDGTCVGYGRGADPVHPAFQFRRGVDFCSGAFLLVRTELFRRLDGLDTAFAPAYYEEVDLCMRIREAGYRIVYEPQAVVDHYEFGSAASSEAAFALQRRNHTIFAERHAASLQRQLPPSTPAVLARMDPAPRRILYIDDRVPYPELGAGYPRAARVLREMVADGWFVTFYPAHDPIDLWEDAYEAFPREVEFMLGHGYGQMAAFLRERDGLYDTILVSRPHNMEGFVAARAGTHRDARVIYDAEALFATREFLRMAQAGRPATVEHRRAMLEREIALTAAAATVTAVNTQEAEVFRGGGHKDVRVLGLGVEPRPVPAGFTGRNGFLFVGTLDEDASPNVDALAFLVGSVLPLVSQRLGRAVQLTVAGRCRSGRAQALAGPGVRLMGLVNDLTPLYASARVFVAPHRFAAGLPLKVQEAVGRGLPAVVSTLLARQLGWQDGQDLLAGSTADELAAACARLHEEPALWHTLRRGGLARLTAESRAEDFSTALRGILRA